MTSTPVRAAAAALLSAVVLLGLSACGQSTAEVANVSEQNSVSGGHSAVREANEHQARRQLAELREQREQDAGN